MVPHCTAEHEREAVSSHAARHARARLPLVMSPVQTTAAAFSLTILLNAAAAGAVLRSAGCGLTGRATGDLHLRVRDGNGVLRDYEVVVPASYSPTIPLSVSFSYHGASGTPAHARAYGIESAPGAAASAIFVYPTGIPYSNLGVGWDDSCSGYDMPFFDNMLDYLKSNYCIDTERVFASGFSWGCDYVTALACCRGNKIRGVSAVACSDDFSDPANPATYRNLPCPVASSAAIRFAHSAGGDAGYPAPLFATTLSLFRSFNHCSATSTATSPSPCQAYNGCATPLIDCSYPGLGHQLPSNFGSDTWAFYKALGPAPASPAPVPVTPSPLVPTLVLLLAGSGLAVLSKRARVHSQRRLPRRARRTTPAVCTESGQREGEEPGAGSIRAAWDRRAAR